jgi:uncharacterized membrane protein HdeD (DUF308 family)
MNNGVLISGILSVIVGLIVLYPSLTSPFTPSLLPPIIAGFFILIVGILLLIQGKRQDRQ